VYSVQCVFGNKVAVPTAQRGVGVWGGCPPSPLGRGFGRELCPLPRKTFILKLKIGSFTAF